MTVVINEGHTYVKMPVTVIINCVGLPLTINCVRLPVTVVINSV